MFRANLRIYAPINVSTHESILEKTSVHTAHIEYALDWIVGMAIRGLQEGGSSRIEEYVALSGSWADRARQIRQAFTPYVKQVMAAPPSAGYEPLLIKRGDEPGVARIKAIMFVYEGKKIAAESRRKREVVQAIRVLARPERSRKAIVKSFEVLMAALAETWVIRTIFTDAGLSDDLFVRSIVLAVRGDAKALHMVLHVAANSAPIIKLPRGPKVTAASASHELFLESQVRCAARAYTYSEYEGDFVDEATKATRLEFPNEVFRPRSASRRLKARPQLAAMGAAEQAAQANDQAAVA